MEIRSLFKRIFKTNNNVNYGTSIELLQGYQAVFTNYNGRIYDSASVRACIDAIARNGAKLSPKHIRSNSREFTDLNNNIKRIISEQPNELMNAYDFYYKVISQLYLNNNAFIYIMRDGNYNPIGLYPLVSGQYQFVEYKDEIYVKFYFCKRKIYTVALKDIIHLKRMFCQNDFTGGNNLPIIETMSIKHIVNEGIINAIKTTQSIRGYIKTTKSMLKPEDVKKVRDQFVTDFIKNGNGDGIAGLDASSEFKEVNLNPQTATDSQVDSIDESIMNYYGVNKKIIQSSYNEDEWNAFYESVLEPIGIMMGLEFTNKIFTYGERSHGNKIMFEANRLQYASNKTKIEVSKSMNNYMMIDEVREIFNLAPLPNGEGQKVMQDLNHINNKIADSYQGGESNE